MRDLPTSTKILIISMVILTFGLGIFVISNSTPVRDAVSIQDLKELKVENPEEVLKKYKSFDNETDANNYIQETIAESNNSLTKYESKIFKDKLLLEPINLLHYTDTRLFIKYNKITIEDKDFEIIKNYISNKKAFPVSIIYETMEESSLAGKFLYYGLIKDSNDKPTDLNDLKIPKAFLVVNGKLEKEYKSYDDMELK